MTINGAIMQLVEMRESSMMPIFFKPCFDKVIETISECEEPHSQPQWIPVSERLPDVGQKVLASTNKTCFTQVFKGTSGASNSSWWWEKNTIKHIFAWMPLPEPYKEG